MKYVGYIVRSLLVLMMPAAIGCIRETDLGPCCHRQKPYLVVRSFDADYKEVTGTGTVKEVVLYVFDQNKAFLETIACAENQRVPLNYGTNPRITVVGWGNSAANNQTMPILKPGTPLDKAVVTLKRSTEAAEGAFVQSPDDLFFGMREVELKASGKNDSAVYPLFIKRKVASMSITVRGIRQLLGTTDTDFSFVVNGTCQSLDFTGKFTGNEAFHHPKAHIDGDDAFTTGIFNTFLSATTPVSIDIYKGSEKIYSVTTDGQGSPFQLSEGRLLNVLVEFSGNIRVRIAVSEWGKTDINQEF